MAFVQFPSLRPTQHRTPRAVAVCMATKHQRMRVVKQADKATLNKLGCETWPTWSCEKSTFPWQYSEDETCWVIEGKVIVTAEDGAESLEVSSGDVAFFEKGLKCTWDVKEDLTKHYKFGVGL